jgi:alkylation response protein AidB-like acyl-CoA dehydrogenase
MDAELMAAESTILVAASAAGLELLAAPRFEAIEPIEAAAKLVVTPTAIRVVDAALRIVGGSALRDGSPLERCYRDVRSGPVPHPNDGRALAALAGQALDQLRQPVGIEGSRLFRVSA